MKDDEVIFRCNKKLIEEFRAKKGGAESLMVADI